MSTIGIQALEGALCGLEDSDVVICVRYDLVEFALRNWNPRADKWKQEQRFGHEFGVRFSNPDFRRHVDAYGPPGFSVSKSGDLLPTLRHALSLNAPGYSRRAH